MAMTGRAVGVPDGVTGLMETLSLVADQDDHLTTLLDLLGQAERFVARVQRGEEVAGCIALLLWDMREAQRDTDQARERVRRLAARGRKVTG